MGNHDHTHSVNTNTPNYYLPGMAGGFNTATVAVIDGYVGQVVVNGVIAWQSRPHKRREVAKRKADKHLSTRLSDIFA
jgi:hypothetical protein